MKFEDFKKRLLNKPEIKKEFKKPDLALEISLILIEARIIKGVTQDALAKMIGSKQSGIARAECGKYLPSLSFLQKIAKAFNTYLIPPKFAFMEKVDVKFNNKITHINQQYESRTIDENIIPFTYESSRKESFTYAEKLQA